MTTMRAHASIVLAAALGLATLVAGCENRGASTASSPGPRITSPGPHVSPAAAPAPAPAVPFQMARGGS
jgi:hypothetical protein